MAQVTKEQIDALVVKLEKFATDLSKGERDALTWLLERASNASGELSDQDLEGVSGGLMALRRRML